MCFDKMKHNLDKKIQYINKIKKEIQRANAYLREEKKRNKNNSSRDHKHLRDEYKRN